MKGVLLVFELWVVTPHGDELFGIFKDKKTALEHFECDKDIDRFCIDCYGDYLGYPFGTTYFRER